MKMILFIILIIALLMLAFIAVSILTIGGTAFILVFGDVIVCIALIVLIIKLIKKRKKK